MLSGSGDGGLVTVHPPLTHTTANQQNHILDFGGLDSSIINDHHNSQKYLPRLEKACVRLVVLDKWLLPREAGTAVLGTPPLCMNISIIIIIVINSNYMCIYTYIYIYI